MNIYLDNASTTFPKPKVVADSIYDYLINVGGNANRANYSNSLDSNRKLLLARETIANFFKFSKAENVIFTNNVTLSLNILLKGILVSGDHVISSTMEHNSVLRPLKDCERTLGVEVDLVQGNEFGFICPDDIRKLIKPNTKLVILSHASNVTGSIQQIEEIGLICFNAKIYFIIDSAQSAGVIDIDMNKIHANAIAFTGHKSLLGPQGIGGFIIDDSLNSICLSIICGGTGSLSHSLDQPTFLPDKFESGTLNMPGIIGLISSIDYINNLGVDSIKENILYLRNMLLCGLKNIDGIIIYGDPNNLNSTSCLSFNYKDCDPSEIAFFLDSKGIKTRSGLHCSPLAHKSIGTYPRGTIRLSLSLFNTKEEIDYTIDVINNIKYHF
ncbi:aminotransferase class V-fold PLP-dependent enzyme [Clostridium vincentii]|uniref:cysteine desulfurase n=1 Tax=Clostridium vincentii TaxID=52704 RepID=A0A2T0BC33_9CLOT|nr:aminotransferase class V-fold PLP-dependent enzyme [Clostridium vincentii]PRR81402.1 putative cysteine desulfurase [Clostridium vincentii]